MSEEKNILIVEDMGLLRKIFSYDLKKVGFTTVLADSAEKGLSLLEEKSVDLILMDVMLPGMNGFEATEKIRAMDAHKKTPIFIISAKCQPSDIEKGLNAGANEYLIKPFKFNELLSKVQKHLD